MWQVPAGLWHRCHRKLVEFERVLAGEIHFDSILNPSPKYGATVMIARAQWELVKIVSRRLCSELEGLENPPSQRQSAPTYLSTPQSFSAVRGFGRGLWKWVSVWLWETVGQADYLKWCGGCSAEVAQVTAESGLRLNCFRAFLIQTAPQDWEALWHIMKHRPRHPASHSYSATATLIRLWKAPAAYRFYWS